MLPAAKRGPHTNGLSPPNGRPTPGIRKLADEVLCLVTRWPGPVPVVAGRAHDGNDFPRLWADRRDSGDPCCAAVDRRGSRHGCWRPASTGAVKQHLGHWPLLGLGERDRASIASNRSVTEAEA